MSEFRFVLPTGGSRVYQVGVGAELGTDTLCTLLTDDIDYLLPVIFFRLVFDLEGFEMLPDDGHVGSIGLGSGVVEADDSGNGFDVHSIEKSTRVVLE